MGFKSFCIRASLLSQNIVHTHQTQIPRLTTTIAHDSFRNTVQVNDTRTHDRGGQKRALISIEASNMFKFHEGRAFCYVT